MGSFNLEALVETTAQRVAIKLAEELKKGDTVRPRLLSVNQAASYLNRSAHSVRHLLQARRLPAVRLDGRVFLDIHDLDRVIEEAKS